jgi:ubiquinone/menaquinone biosynthesis C-methylase UbiE
MPREIQDEVLEQRHYYERTAEHYESMHVNPTDEHGKALSAFMSLAEISGPVNSVLDVGAGTGRALRKLRDRWPLTKLVGIEPVDALRHVGHKSGISSEELISGDALDLHFDDNSFDYVIETGVLHHISKPSVAVREMARVARKGIMISDSNSIGQGNYIVRAIKYFTKGVGLWKVLIWAQTRGKMYKISDGDGVFYSFSAFDCIESFQTKFPLIHYLNTAPCDGFNIYRGASHVMIFASKSDGR